MRLVKQPSEPNKILTLDNSIVTVHPDDKLKLKYNLTCSTDKYGYGVTVTASLNSKRYPYSHIVLNNWGIEVAPEFVVDHIDRDPFNNHIENLRIVAPSTNNLNNGTTGITFIDKLKKFRVTLVFERKIVYRDYFKDKVTAEKASAAKRKLLMEEFVLRDSQTLLNLGYFQSLQHKREYEIHIISGSAK